MHTSPGGPLSVQCFTQQSTDETLGPWVDVRGKAYVTFYVTGHGTTSSGVVSIEEASPLNLSAPDAPVVGLATGNYSSVTTKNASDVSGDKQSAVHLTVQGYCFVRARISTEIGGGGTVSVGMVAY